MLQKYGFISVLQTGHLSLSLLEWKKISLDNNTVAMNLVKKIKKLVFVERN